MSRKSYKDMLKLLSARTGVPLPSLLVSFGVLHEITAIVPLVGIFYGVRSLGVGERLVMMAEGSEGGLIQEQCKVWVREGEAWAERVGRRYGVFGFTKTPKGTTFDKDHSERTGERIAGDVANAVLAYGATKALLPVRLGFSFYLSPAFTRGVVEPIRGGVMRILRRR